MCRQVGSQPDILASFAFTKCCACFFDLCGHHNALLPPRHGECHATSLIVLPVTPDPSARRRVPIGPLCTTCDGCCRRTAIVSRRINIRPTRTRHQGALESRSKDPGTGRSLPRGNNRRGALSRDPICLGWSVCWQSGSPAASTAPWWCTTHLVSGSLATKVVDGAGFPRTPRWRSNAMCWEDAVGLDLGANTSTHSRFISSTHEPGHIPRAGPSGGRHGPMDAPVAADQLPDLSAVQSQMAYLVLMRKGGWTGCARGKATCEILDATLALSRSLGSDHAFVRLSHSCFLFLLHAAAVN